LYFPKFFGSFFPGRGESDPDKKIIINTVSDTTSERKSETIRYMKGDIFHNLHISVWKIPKKKSETGKNAKKKAL